MRHAWFKRVGWIHVPVSAAGWMVALAGAGLCVQAFLAVDRASHSVSDTLYGVFPFVVPTLLALDWVASRTSGPQAPDGR